MSVAAACLVGVAVFAELVAIVGWLFWPDVRNWRKRRRLGGTIL